MTRGTIVGALLFGMVVAHGAWAVEKAATRRVEDAGLRYTIPDTWQRVPAASSMRAAQYRIEGPTPDAADDAQVVLFFFGEGQGGTTEANLDRWYAQFTQPDGKPSRDRAVVTTRTMNGLKVTSVDLSGTYSAQMPPGTGGAPQAGMRMLAAVIEGPGGPWFLRIVGPAATVNAVAPEFDQTLRSLEAHR